MRISFSKMGYFKSCPRKYYLRYIEKLLPPKTIPLISGSALHKASANEYQKIKDSGASKTSIVVDNCVNIYDGGLITARDTGGVIGLEKADKERDLIAASQREYHKRVMVKKKPVEIEKEFTVNLGNDGTELTGYIDRIDDDNAIKEIKTAGRTPSLEMYTPQICLYCAATKRNKAEIEVVIKKKQPDIIIQKFEFNPLDFTNILANVRQVVDTIKSMDGKPKEYWWQNSGFMCNMCWYKEECFGKTGR